MDSDLMSTSSWLKAEARCPFQQHFLPRTENSKLNLDRFIPNRSAMDFDYAHYALTEGRNGEKPATSPSREAYRKRLAEVLNLNRTRILAFKNKPPNDHYSAPSLHQPPESVIPRRRHISQTPELAFSVLPNNIVSDFYLNLLDWSTANVLAIALDNIVCLYDASSGSASELVTIDEEEGPVTSLNWSPEGCYLAVGLNNSHIQLWDTQVEQRMKTLKGGHEERVGSLAWNNHILTTGGMDGHIINHDVRSSSHIVQTYRGHTGEVCGLKWSESGRHLASGGDDDVVHVWDQSSAQSLHRLQDHKAAVKAIAWCPYQSNLLATGGGRRDRTIRFWNTVTGACLKSVDTGSQVSSLLWSKHERELLSSHGFTKSHLTLWKYPSMVKMADLTGHTSSVLYTAQSPDGCTVASAAADDTLRLWNVFGDPAELAKKRVPKPVAQPFSYVNRIR